MCEVIFLTRLRRSEVIYNFCSICSIGVVEGRLGARGETPPLVENEVAACYSPCCGYKEEPPVFYQQFAHELLIWKA